MAQRSLIDTLIYINVWILHMIQTPSHPPYMPLKQTTENTVVYTDVRTSLAKAILMSFKENCSITYKIKRKKLFHSERTKKTESVLLSKSAHL